MISTDRDAVGRVICRPAGELDLYTVPRFRQALAGVDWGSQVVIDMSGVSFIDSAGVGALVGGVRRIRDRGGDVAVACPRPGLRRLLHTIGVDRLVDISEDVEHAMVAT
ncbi:MAG: STAS domain-containing protein [Acidimicrobiaceae bacterium]|nr:STAS domain-containing protein [Acidimicrobiaceae bacterium]